MNNWIVGTLQSAFDTWNEKLTEIWSLVTTTPQAFRGGEIWNTIVTINDGLKAFGYGLLVLFFAMSVFRSAASFRDLQRPEFALRHFIRFIIAKVAVGSAMEIMTAVFSVCGGVVQSIMGSIGGMSAASVTLPQEIADAIEEVGFFQSVPLWMVTFLGSLFITVLSFILIMTVYGRFFRLYMFTALAPLPLASFAGEDTSFMGKAFLKSYIGVCMEGAVVVLACLIFSAFASSGAPIVDTSLPVVTMSWQYVAQTIFNMLILVALIKGAERIAAALVDEVRADLVEAVLDMKLRNVVEDRLDQRRSVQPVEGVGVLRVEVDAVVFTVDQFELAELHLGGVLQAFVGPDLALQGV